MSGIQIQKLTKCFGKTLVIDDLSLDVAPGEMVALLGPSGCGKSTTLLAVSGIHRTDSGKILIDGRDMTNEPPQTRNVGVTFQSYALYPHMSVEQNIGFPLKVRGESPAEIRRKVTEMAALVQIDALLHRKPAELSGGQQQRVSLARAIIRRPDVLLMDEPLANLDASLRMTMRAEIRRIQREAGITAILVTHDQVEAMSMCDRIAIMEKGRIVQVDTPVQMYANPHTEFVAGFLGNPPISFIAGQVSAQQFESSGVRIALGGPCSLPQGAVRAGLRPEHVAFVTEGGNPAQVSFVEHQGREILYYLQLTSGDVIRALQSGGPVLRAGDSVQWRIDSTDVLFFNPQGERLHAA